MNKLMGILGLAIFTVGCGDRGLVSNVKVNTYELNGDSYGEIVTTLDTDQVSLPALTLPIVDPNNGWAEYGSFVIRPVFPAGAEVAIAVNINQVGQVPYQSPRLPNGNRLPLGGISDSQIVTLRAGSTGVKVYFAFTDSVAMVGTAIPIREFDQMGRYVGGANLFPIFSLPNGVRGAAGIFTGRSAGQNGLAFFVDAGRLLHQQMGQSGSVLALSSTSSALRTAAGGQGNWVRKTYKPYIPSSMRFKDQSPGRRKKKSIHSYLNGLHKRQAHVTIR